MTIQPTEPGDIIEEIEALREAVTNEAVMIQHLTKAGYVVIRKEYRHHLTQSHTFPPALKHVLPSMERAVKSMMIRKLGEAVFGKVTWTDEETLRGREIRAEITLLHRGD